MTSSAQALSISLLTFRISPSFESYYNTKVQCGREKSYRRERKHASGKHFPPQGKRYFLPAKNNFRKKLLSVNRFLHKPGLSFLADRKRASIFVNTKKKRPWKKTKNKFRRKTIAKSIHRPISTGWPARAKKRESVRSRKGSVTNHWPKDGLTANIPAHEASSPSTTPAVPSTEEYSTTHGEESRLPSG